MSFVPLISIQTIILMIGSCSLDGSMTDTLCEYAVRPEEYESLNLWTYLLGPSTRRLGNLKRKRTCSASVWTPRWLSPPRWVGRWRPCGNDDNELFCASLLALLSSWTTLNELDVAESFSDSLDLFLASTDQQVLEVVDNIRYMQSVGF